MPITQEGTQRFFRIFWKAIFMLVWPLVLVPILFLKEGTEFQCFYVVLLMFGYILTECIPYGATGLIPLVTLPLMGIGQLGNVSKNYLNPTNILFIATHVLATSMESSGLNVRLAIQGFVRITGIDYEKIFWLYSFVVFFFSVFISNTVVTILLLPIMEAYLREMEANNLGPMFNFPADYEELTEEEKLTSKRPTKITLAFYLISAYASTWGGCLLFQGTDTNFKLDEIFKAYFGGDSIKYGSFFSFSVAPVISGFIITTGLLHLTCFGVFFPNSPEKQQIMLAKQNEQAKEAIKNKDLGPVTFHEKMVNLILSFAALFFIFRHFVTIQGWDRIFEHNNWTHSAGVSCFFSILLFMIPSKPDFLKVVLDNEQDRPKAASPPLVVFKNCQEKIPWGMMLLLGGGFALGEGMRCSGLLSLLNKQLQSMSKDSTGMSQFVMNLLSSAITEMVGNYDTADKMVPLASEMAIVGKINPKIATVITGIMSSSSFMLPIASPPNATVVHFSNMRCIILFIVGFLVKLIYIGLWSLIWATAGEAVFGSLPDYTNGTIPADVLNLKKC